MGFHLANIEWLIHNSLKRQATQRSEALVRDGGVVTDMHFAATSFLRYDHVVNLCPKRLISYAISHIFGFLFVGIYWSIGL